MFITEKARSFLIRLKKGEFGYIAKRIFPGGNIVFYMGRQLVFRLNDFGKFQLKCKNISHDTSCELAIADTGCIEELCTDFPQHAMKFRERFDKGDKCYVTRLGKTITGYIWVREAPVFFETNSMWQFNPTEMDGVWFFDVFVKPEYRRRGIFSYMLCKVYDEHKQRGYRTLYSETSHSNNVSVVSHLDSGFYIYRDIRYISLFGFKTYLAYDPFMRRTKINFRYIMDVRKHKL